MISSGFARAAAVDVVAVWGHAIFCACARAGGFDSRWCSSTFTLATCECLGALSWGWTCTRRIEARAFIRACCWQALLQSAVGFASDGGSGGGADEGGDQNGSDWNRHS